jgi:hypothetical protein
VHPGALTPGAVTEPLGNYPEARRAYPAGVAACTAALGEPWISFYDPVKISAELREHGFKEQDDLGLGEIAICYLGTSREQAEKGPGPRVIRAHRVY